MQKITEKIQLLGTKMIRINKEETIPLVEAIIIVLIIVDTFSLVLITFYNLDPVTVSEIIYFDLTVCIILFCEFIYRIRTVNDKKRFIKKNWYVIIAMIPVDFIASKFFFPLRLLRLVRITRVLKVFALFKTSLVKFFEFLQDTHLHLSLGILIFTIFSGTIIFFLLEHGQNGAIKSLWDAFWYVLPTVATVGAAGISPVTDAGKLLSMFLMLIGLVLFGMLTASIAAWYVNLKEKENKEKKESELEEIKDLLINMQSEVNDLKDFIKRKNQ